MKKILLATGAILLAGLSVQANVDSQHLMTEQFMLNSGYSSNMAKYTELITRDPYAPTDDKFPKKNFKNTMKNIWRKIDPTAFPDENNTWHDIKMNTGINDLN